VPNAVGIGFGEGHAPVPVSPSYISCDFVTVAVDNMSMFHDWIAHLVVCSHNQKHLCLSKSDTAMRHHVTIHQDSCTCFWAFSGSDPANKFVGDILLLASSKSSGGKGCSDNVGLSEGSGVALAASSALDFTNLP
jgi:hypothetical protein